MSQHSQVLQHVSHNVRYFRDLKHLSQQQLADLAGVSRRMIAGIESGQDNISLAKLSLIASGLGVDFATLVSPLSQQDQAVINELAWQGKSKESFAKLMTSIPAKQVVELWVWSLEPKEQYQAEPDPQGWHEMLYVIEGQLTLDVAGMPKVLQAGDSLVYSSAVNYCYQNWSDKTVKFIRNVVY